MSPGTTLIVSTINTPDFFARAKVYEDYKVYVVFDDNQIIASAACGLHKAITNNKVEKVGHEFQAFVDPEYRGRRVTGQLTQAREEYLRKQGAVLSYGLIMEGNKPSIRHTERQDFQCHSTLVMPSIAVFKELPIAQNRNIRAMVTDDLPAVANLLNKTWKGYEFYEPTTAADLSQLITRTPKYDYGNIFLLEEGGEIKACLGFWDWSKVTQITVIAFSLKMRIMAFLMDIAKIFRPVPSPPVLGNSLKQIVLTPIGFEDTRHISDLLKYVNNRAFAEGIEQLFFICNRGHPLLSSLKGFIHIDTGMHFYVKPLRNNLSLGDNIVYVSGLDL
jgi:GNAT superfamily N-acetyltransferase